LSSRAASRVFKGESFSENKNGKLELLVQNNVVFLKHYFYSKTLVRQSKQNLLKPK
jgi:hypothetical protein